MTETTANNRRINVLAIDGGGIRGIIPATILAKLEERLGRPLWQVFDLIAGTSTGGIIAAAIGAGAKNGDAYRPGELVDMYVQNGPTIFHTNFLTPEAQLLGPKYSPEPLEKVLLKFFGESELASAKTNLLISSYDIEGQRPFFFKSAKIAKYPEYNWKLREIARATSAAPTYFPPIHLDNSRAAYTLVDGGVCVNNPSVAAYAEAHYLYPGATDFLVLSVGTGDRQDHLTYEQVRHWGLIGWAKQIAPLFMDSVSETSDYELHYLLGNARNFRFQADLVKSSPEMDCVTAANLAALSEDALSFLQLKEVAAKFDRVCSLLAQAKSSAAAASQTT